MIAGWISLASVAPEHGHSSQAIFGDRLLVDIVYYLRCSYYPSSGACQS